MSLNTTDVKKIAHLARLHIAETEIEPLTEKLDDILTLIEKMNQIDTKTVKPMAHPLDTTQPLRPDKITEQNQRDLFLQNAPQTLMGLYLVPQVIETEE